MNRLLCAFISSPSSKFGLLCEVRQPTNVFPPQVSVHTGIPSKEVILSVTSWMCSVNRLILMTSWSCSGW